MPYVLILCKHYLGKTKFGENANPVLYDIVQYLMRSSQSKSVTLEIFTNARPPGIKKDKHVQGLYYFYNECLRHHGC